MSEVVTYSNDDRVREAEHYERILAQIDSELSKARSDNEMLKDTIVRLSMKLTGVTG